jgi:putative transposase
MQRQAEVAFSAQQVADIYARGDQEAEKPEPMRPVVTRMAGNLAMAPRPDDVISEEEVSMRFSRAVARATGGASILEFPKGNTPGE